MDLPIKDVDIMVRLYVWRGDDNKRKKGKWKKKTNSEPVPNHGSCPPVGPSRPSTGSAALANALSGTWQRSFLTKATSKIKLKKICSPDVGDFYL